MVLERAPEAYRAAQAEAIALGARLLNKIAEHGQKAAVHPKNWGYVGDLTYLNEQLRQLLEFMGDTPPERNNG